MNNVKRHIIKWLCLAVLPWTVWTSCGNDAPDGDLGGASAGQPVSLRIVVGSDMATRAVPSPTDEDEIGSVDENHIDIAGGDYCILFFDNENKYLSRFDPDDVTLVPAATDKHIYNVTGSLTAPLPSEFKVVVLANWGKDKYPETTAGKTTIEDVCDTIYTYTWDFVPSADSGKGIPMYGIKTCSGVSFTPNWLSSLGTVDMLRAMAKVEIICEDEDIKITSATLNCVNPRGYCTPSEMYDWTTNVNSVHIPTDINVETKEKTYGGGTDKAVFYIPEYENPDNKATVSLKFQLSEDDNNTEDNDNTKEGTIYFKDYAQDAPFDIARNYVYRYTVRFKTSLEIDYTVCPWQEYTVKIPLFD